MHLECARESFLAKFSPPHLDDFAITPHIDRYQVKILTHRLGDITLGEVVLDQGIAVGAACLPEIQYQALTFGRGLGDILFEI